MINEQQVSQLRSMLQTEKDPQRVALINKALNLYEQEKAAQGAQTKVVEQQADLSSGAPTMATDLGNIDWEGLGAKAAEMRNLQGMSDVDIRNKLLKPEQRTAINYYKDQPNLSERANALNTRDVGGLEALGRTGLAPAMTSAARYPQNKDFVDTAQEGEKERLKKEGERFQMVQGQSAIDEMPDEIKNNPEMRYAVETLAKYNQLTPELTKVLSSQVATTGQERATSGFAREGQAEKDAAAMERARLEAQSREKIAGMEASTAQNKLSAEEKNAYQQRTYAMKPNQIENITQFDNAMTQLKSVKNLFDESYVGPIVGRYKNVKDFFGQLGAEEATFRSAKQEFDNALIKLRSGTAVTANEMERLKKEVGDFTGSPEQFKAKVDRALNSLSNSKSIYLNGMKKAGYDLGEYEKEIAPVQTYEKPSNKETGTSLLPPDKAARLEELRRKKAAGTLGK